MFVEKEITSVLGGGASFSKANDHFAIHLAANFRLQKSFQSISSANSLEKSGRQFRYVRYWPGKVQ